MKTSEKIVHILSLLIAIAGGILSFGDKWISMPGVPDWLTHSWPTFVFAATVVDRMGNLLIDKIPKIFASANPSTVIGIVVILFLPVGLTGCGGLTGLGTHTTMYYPNGRKAFETAGDNVGIGVDMEKAGAGKFTAATNTHSTTVIAHGTAYSEFLDHAGTAIGNGAKAFAKP